MRSVLVIDDESGIRSALRDILEDERYAVLTAEDGPTGLEILEKEKVDLVILDIWLPRMGGMDVLKEIKARRPELEVVIISGHANIDLAVQAVKLGAFDFIEKPLSIDRIITSARNALAIGSLKEENRRLKRSAAEPESMIATSPAMAGVLSVMEQAAASDARVLISGENGTGKEILAREIHRRSQRSTGPFVEVNCAAIPDSLIESELFGHEKGSFTDAVARRKGKFEMADGGTLFLDEIGDMSLSAQAKVLRAIQESRFERVGGEEPVSVDIRIIAASNKDLRKEIKAGTFREDLYFRLAVVPIHLPPLRERKEDIAVMARSFLEAFCARDGGPAMRFSDEALARLAAHPWPGNIRELKNVVERVSVMATEEVIGAGTLDGFLAKAARQEADPAPEALPPEFAGLKLAEAKDLFEKGLIVQKLRECGYNVSRTAEALGIYPSNLHAKLKKYGIQPER